MAKPTFNPLKLYIRGYDWTGRTSRRELLLFLGICVVPQLGLMYQRAALPDHRLLETFLWLLVALTVVPMWGHLLRRVNEIRWPGWVLLLMFVPYLALVVVLVLLIKGRGQRRLYELTAFRSLGVGLACILAFLCLTRAFWEPFAMVGGSMKPSLLVGDVVAVGKVSNSFDRGDVVALKRADGHAVMGRIIGIGGDTVQFKDGRVWLNDEQLPQEQIDPFQEVMEPQGALRHIPRCTNGAVGHGAICEKDRYVETLPDGQAYQVLNIFDRMPSDDTAVFRVPADHYFIVGDNRDNTADSRYAAQVNGFGMVPHAAVIGQAHRILYSYNGPSAFSVWNWRPARILKAVK
ncbi:signal peptidase I [Marivivens aquimaris]|uniref:signal peptidase I n=1 Tax=Marivivens aquimaris TaxID=2774876 RepID=UPI00187E3589|nr:signal peptidase I [Marivivens aquimaris]